MPRVSACVIINELPAYKQNDENIAMAVVAIVVFKTPSFCIHLISIDSLSNFKISGTTLRYFALQTASLWALYVQKMCDS
jgi:hypothetical protein